MLRCRRVSAVAVPLLAALAFQGCGAPPERGYFAPAGADFGDTLAVYREESDELVLELACQGTYVNRVSGRQVFTVHVQLDLTRPRSGDLVLPREAFLADVRFSADQPPVPLRLSDAWSGVERVDGDLVVPGWSLRPFDLFFDAPELVGEAPPPSVLLRWTARAAGAESTGQCGFRSIPAGDPRRPGNAPIQDLAFGYRNGYYLPGRIVMGPRAWRPSDEERLHYVFHVPGAWQW